MPIRIRSDSRAAGAILDVVRSLFPGPAGELPFVPLASIDRRRLGGHLFQEAPFLVEAVAQALRHKALFSHIPVTAEGLEEAQDRADAWKMLRAHLVLLLQLTNDSYLYEQGTAIAQALMVINQVEAENQLDYSPDPHRKQRQRLLTKARIVLGDRQRRKILRRARKDRNDRKRQRAPLKPAARPDDAPFTPGGRHRKGDGPAR